MIVFYCPKCGSPRKAGQPSQVFECESYLQGGKFYQTHICLVAEHAVAMCAGRVKYNAMKEAFLEVIKLQNGVVNGLLRVADSGCPSCSGDAMALSVWNTFRMCEVAEALKEKMGVYYPDLLEMPDLWGADPPATDYEGAMPEDPPEEVLG